MASNPGIIKYKMDHRERGIALVINIQNFDPSPPSTIYGCYFLNLHVINNAYITSPNLGSFDTVSAFSHNVVKKVPVTANYGYMIFDQYMKRFQMNILFMCNVYDSGSNYSSIIINPSDNSVQKDLNHIVMVMLFL